MTKLTVLPNSFLTLNYRLTLPSGDDYINTFIDRPATVLMGSGQFAPCFEKVLIGLSVGDQKSALLPPEESFGERKEELIQWVSLGALKRVAMMMRNLILATSLNLMRLVALNTQAYCNRLTKRVPGLISITRLLEGLLPSKLKLLRFFSR